MGEERTRAFSCSHCMVDFEINVEPGKDDKALREEFPESLAWLKNEMVCPFCCGSLEEMS